MCVLNFILRCVTSALEQVEHNIPVCILRCVTSAPLLQKFLE